MGGATPPTSTKSSSRWRTILRRSQTCGLCLHRGPARVNVSDDLSSTCTMYVQILESVKAHNSLYHTHSCISALLTVPFLSMHIMPFRIRSTRMSSCFQVVKKWFLLNCSLSPLTSAYTELLVFQSWLRHEGLTSTGCPFDHPDLWYTLTFELLHLRA